MIISNYNDQYIKITSDYLADFLANPGDYTSLDITANMNCCRNALGEIIETSSIPANNTAWYIDLDVAVQSDSLLQELNIQNLTTLGKNNVLTLPIDLGYVSATCVTGPCTLQTFNSHFAPLFKAAIDDWFDNVMALTSNVSVTFSGNTVIVDNMPANFIMYNAGYGSASPYTFIFFNFGAVNSNIFINADGIFLTPAFFGLTSITDGIYKVTLKFVKDNGAYIAETNCAFIDVTIKCKVAALLQNILQESKINGSEKVSTIAHILHYALFNGSNCGCNCAELCKVYAELVGLLENIDPLITNDCGC